MLHTFHHHLPLPKETPKAGFPVWYKRGGGGAAPFWGCLPCSVLALQLAGHRAAAAQKQVGRERLVLRLCGQGKELI